LPLPDLRTVTGKRPKKLSPEFRDTVNDVVLKQQWYKEYLREEGQKRLEFVGRFSMANEVKEVAVDIQVVLGLDDTLRSQATTWEDFLTALVANCESKGILVFRNGVVGNNNYRHLSVREFRGFAIADDLAPVIFINTQDSRTAQIFTLVHEAAHLWLGESGISNPNMRTRTSDPTNRIERFCNKVSAEVLIPEQGFTGNWDSALEVEQNLQHLSKLYKVSTSVVLRRAYELDAMTYAEYLHFLKREEAAWKRVRVRRQEGGDFHKLLLSRNSDSLTRALIAAAMDGRIPSHDAARLLGVRMDVINKMSERLAATA
jgi:Zn-dependent peptidase ImmA (M78 family)